LKKPGQLQYPSSLEKMKFGGPRWRIYTGAGEFSESPTPIGSLVQGGQPIKSSAD
jgi:hypothetical protein